MQDASDVAIALLIAGGFLSVLNHTGALEAGIVSLLSKFKGNILIASVIFIFAILGTVFGFWVEIPPFVVVIVPLFVLAGYDVMTGLGVIFIGAIVGNMASIVNPFSVGAAVAALAFVVIGIFLQSTSGVASISMPIIGTVAAVIFASTAGGEVAGQIILTSAFTIGINFVSGFYPGAIIMGTLELVNIPYNYYLKFIGKILVILIIVAAAIISVAPYIGLV